ncbi:hypothetical protein QJS10_CPA05g00014 [Acorus calamus]|uniref:Uncharacterized protein n=1 Tax=Acorus calamus TaxID=4465 RepID=A0AAV9ES59_ACOCL|nr:hypothetical protein QJS10_CPA05g00014 [Acorus calamus]
MGWTAEAFTGSSASQLNGGPSENRSAETVGPGNSREVLDGRPLGKGREGTASDVRRPVLNGRTVRGRAGLVLHRRMVQASL